VSAEKNLNHEHSALLRKWKGFFILRIRIDLHHCIERAIQSCDSI